MRVWQGDSHAPAWTLLPPCATSPAATPLPGKPCKFNVCLLSTHTHTLRSCLQQGTDLCISSSIEPCLPMEPAQHIAFLSAQLAQTKASLRYQAACAEAAERRLRAFERTRLGGFMGSTSSCGDRCVYQTPLKSGASHLAFGSPRSLISDSASTQPYGSPSRSCVAPQHNSSSRWVWVWV
eukprot:scaffold180817_cov21-Tisochrysis_lutea.AAC.1